MKLALFITATAATIGISTFAVCVIGECVRGFGVFMASRLAGRE